MFLSGRATERFGAGMTSVVGAAILVVATVPFVLITAGSSFVLIGAAMVLRGIGIGLAIMPAMTAAFAVLDPDQVNDAAPQLTVLQRVGGSLGTAIIAVVLQGKLTHAAAHPSSGALAGAFAHTYWWVMALTLVALLPTVALASIERRARERTGAAETQIGLDADGDLVLDPSPREPLELA